MSSKQEIKLKDDKKEVSVSVEHDILPSSEELAKIKDGLGEWAIKEIFNLTKKEQKARHKEFQRRHKEKLKELALLDKAQNKDFYISRIGRILATFLGTLVILFGFYLIHIQFYGWGITAVLLSFITLLGSLINTNSKK